MSTTSNRGLTRRSTITAMSAAAFMSGTRLGWAAAKVEPITIVINQSPWFDSFRKTVELYEKETGNKVELDVNPFAGSLEKQRNSVRASKGQYDLLIMNSGWFAEMYFGGFVEAITDIEPGFKLDPEVYTLGDTIYFDPAKKTMTPAGKLMSMPISPLIPMLYYRGDLYKEAGLKAPETFAELEANARKFQSPPKMYGIVQRGARGPHTVAYDFYPYLYGFGGGIFKDQAAGDYSITLNDEKGKAALDYYIRLAREAGHPKTASLDQAEVIQNHGDGQDRAHHDGHRRLVANGRSRRSRSSSTRSSLRAPPHVPGVPTAPGLGHWLGGISKNVPDDRKRATVEFLRWFQTKDAQVAATKAGGIPINAAAYRDPVADERKYRWMKPLAEALKHSVNIYQFPEASEVIAVLELGLNRAIAGEITSAQSPRTPWPTRSTASWRSTTTRPASSSR